MCKMIVSYYKKNTMYFCYQQKRGAAMPGPRSLGPRGFLTEEEKNNMPKVTKSLLVRILSYLKPYSAQFAVVFVTILLSAVVGLFPSLITGKIVDEALVGKNLTLLIKLLIAAFCTLTFSQLIGSAENYINAWISQRIICDMRNQMYHHLLYMPHSFFTTEKQGDIITRMDTDISGVSTVISGTLSSVVSNIATVVTTLVALFTMSWKLALVGIAVIPLLVLPTKSVGKTRYKLATAGQEKRDEMNQIINETLSASGSMLVKIFTREQAEYEAFTKVNDEVSQAAMKEQRSGSLFRIVMGMFTQIGPLLIYFAGGLLIINYWDTALTVGTITATVALINRLYRPVESLMSIGVDFTRSLALFTRIFDYFDRENKIISPENGKTAEISNSNIEYKHVAFGYNPEKQILSDVNFTVPGGKMYAIVGPSGSGKSTVVNFIPRIYDVDSGSVTINGVDVRDFDLKYLREHIGIVTQETYLFNGTILENLKYANSNATTEEIEEACRTASIHELISSLPDGYNTEVGNRGLKLSGGEKQRISLARVILKNPDILILDEATSALDSISENAIQDALEVMMKGRTSLVIAHRLSTILKADRILVVNNGVIAEQGTHEELLAQNGIYRELYETQFRMAIDAEQTESSEFPVETLSSEYSARKITEADITDVYNLFRSNARYYHTVGERPSRQRLTEVITQPAENGTASGNHLVGFYDSDELIAVLDLITGYPKQNSAFIGWFMVDADHQRQGIGSQLFADIRAAVKAYGIDSVTLRCPALSKEAAAFWENQGFKSEATADDGKTIIMYRDI